MHYFGGEPTRGEFSDKFRFYICPGFITYKYIATHIFTPADSNVFLVTSGGPVSPIGIIDMNPTKSGLARCRIRNLEANRKRYRMFRQRCS